MSENLPTKFDPAKWQDKFKDVTAGQRKAERASGAFFSIKAAQLTFQGNNIPNNKMDVVVLESIHERTYYPEDYGGDVTSPTCYSFSQDGENMVPHPEVANKQHATCEGCPRDKWGTGKNEKGKACKQGRRLALMSAADLDSPDKVMGATTGYLRVPVMSVRNYANYLQAVVGGSDLPLFCHITRVSVTPDPKIQVKVLFERVSGIDRDDVMEAVFNRASAEADNIAFPYPKPDAEEKPEAPKKQRKF
jgi:hypothetical protein